MNSFKEWVIGHKGMVIGMVIGLIIFILFMTIGWWTLLLFLFVGLGALLGSKPEMRASIKGFFSNLFAGKK